MHHSVVRKQSSQSSSVWKMTSMCLVTLCILIQCSLLDGQNIDQECPSSDQDCRDQKFCPSFQQQKKQLKSRNTKNGKLQEKLLELTALVCNREERKVCCSDSKEEDSLCPKDEDVCKDELSCPAFILKKKTLDKLGKETQSYQATIEELKSVICNKQKRKVCCSPVCSESEVLGEIVLKSPMFRVQII